MYLNFYITGDIHGDVNRIAYFANNILDSEKSNNALIILGDAGFNFGRKTSANYRKQKANQCGVRVYCVRGNHEDRPENFAKDMVIMFDEDIGGEVLLQPKFDNIRYLRDGACYNINGNRILVIGGAYSVDKPWRIMSGDFWYEQELLTTEEMSAIEKKYTNEHFYAVLSHTGPDLYLPRDQFIAEVDQRTVDYSMELWMDKFKDKITWDKWLFGHYHVDRQVTSKVRIMYFDILPFILDEDSKIFEF